MPYKPDQIIVSNDSDALFTDCAKNMAQYINTCINERGACHIALAGGSTPERLYLTLSSEPLANEIPWEFCHFYFGDERMVAHDHSDSNYAMARRALFDRAPIPANNIHPIPTHCEQARDCANEYETTMSKITSLDLVLLGIGQDGHTASLFPDTEILSETQRLVSAVFVEKLQSWRISLTYPCINLARRVIILAQGSGKAAIIKHVLHSDKYMSYPISQVKPQGDLIWFLDQEALTGQ